MTRLWTSKTLIWPKQTAAADALSVSIDTDKAPYWRSSYFWTMWPLHQVHNGCKTSSWMKVSVPSIMWSTWPTISRFLLGVCLVCLTWMPLKEWRTVCEARAEWTAWVGNKWFPVDTVSWTAVSPCRCGRRGCQMRILCPWSGCLHGKIDP